MLNTDALRFGLYMAIATIIVALTAVFGKFEERFVIAGVLNLSQVLLAIIVGGTGLYVAARSQQSGMRTAVVTGMLASLIVGVGLALVVLIEASIDLTFIFPDLKTDPIGPALTFGLELLPGLLALLALSLVLGVISSALLMLPVRVRQVGLMALALTVVVGVLQSQINKVITLPDALALAAVGGGGYIAGGRMIGRPLSIRLLAGTVIGAAAGLVLAVAAGSGLEAGSVLRGAGDMPRLLTTDAAASMVVFGVFGLVGVMISAAPRGIFYAGVGLLVAVIILGGLNAQGGMTLTMAVITFFILSFTFWFMPGFNRQAESRFEDLDPQAQQSVRRIAVAIAFVLMLAAPSFLGQYITSVIDLVGLYVIMGIGLTVTIGYAGLLDLGYVAFFAIGAYTVGILTTPSLITCGGINPSEIARADIATTCTGVLTFWQAWPLCILVAGCAGLLLGIPILRLRGDYLAIVTLGFGEIIRLIALSNTFSPLLGGAQGIANIPFPVLDLTALNPAWRIGLGGATSIYYLILAGVMVAAFVVVRLGGTRLGRAWRAMRADEDVARAMGIDVVRIKLLAYATGASFAGLGGAIFGSWLQGIFPNSFTLLVSINVVSMIIIGGMGSIPGVILGAFVLIGLPEVLRELQDYRLLAFGVLLVVTMLSKPQGLLPPPLRRLSEQALLYRAQKGA